MNVHLLPCKCSPIHLFQISLHMKFFIQDTNKINTSSLIYREEDYSFDTEPHMNNGFASIMINDVQLEIDEKGKITYIWGPCPLIQYTETNKIPKNYESGNLFLKLDKPPVPGRDMIRSCV